MAAGALLVWKRAIDITSNSSCRLENSQTLIHLFYGASKMALEKSGQSSHSIIRISNTNLFLKIPKTSQGIPLSDPIKSFDQSAKKPI